MTIPSFSGILRLLVAGACGVVASLALEQIDFPAAWLTGGLIGASVAVMCGIRFELPSFTVNISYITLGALFGSTIRPSLIEQALMWAGSLLLSCLSLVLIMYVSTWYMRRFEGWDTATSFLGTAPGALPAVVALASEFDVDQKKIVLSQTVRLFSFMLFVPLIFSSSVSSSLPIEAEGVLDLKNFVLVFAVATFGGLVLRALKLPGSLIVGALIATGVLYGTDLAHGTLPIILLNCAFLVIGMLVGSQIARLSLGELFGSMRAVIVALLIGVVIATGCAFVAAEFTGLTFIQVLLAYLPGAMEGLTVLGFVLGLDPAFISVHHVVRFLFVIFSLPIVTRSWIRRVDERIG